MKHVNWEVRGMAARLSEVVDEIKGNAVCWDPKAKPGEPTMKDVSWNPAMQAGLVGTYEPMGVEDFPKLTETKEERSVEYDLVFRGFSAPEATAMRARIVAALLEITRMEACLVEKHQVVSVSAGKNGRRVVVTKEETK